MSPFVQMKMNTGYNKNHKIKIMLQRAAKSE